MSDEVVFYTSPLSRGRMAHWMLEEVGADYTPHLLNLEKQEHKKPDYLAINPMGKVPAIVHRGVTITEVAAICAYLADAFPAAKLAPAISDPRRGSYLRWMFFACNCVEPAIIDRMLARPPVSRPGALSYGSYDDVIKTLELALAPGPYILGDQFSAPDLYLSSQIGFGFMTKAVEPRPLLQSYLARCMDRPSAKRFLAKNEEWLAKLKAQA